MKTINKILCALSALSMMAVSCAKENAPVPQATAISVDVPAIVDLPESKASSVDINVTCDGYWIVESTSWIKVSASYGTGNGKISVSFQDNTDELGNARVPRSGEITIVAGQDKVVTIPVNQLGDRTLLLKKLPYEVNFKNSQDLFTIEDKKLSEGLSGVWVQSGKYGMRASAYSGGNKASESWLVSPEINLVPARGAILSFTHTYSYISAASVSGYLKLVVTSDEGETWTPVEIPNYGPGSWSEVSSGSIDLSSYTGKVIQFAFVYTSDTSNAPTWEIFDVKFVEEAEE